MTALIKGINTHYIKDGSGDPILILPGWCATSATYNILIKQFSAKYEVYALDLPGFGITPEPAAPWSVDDYVDFVLEFIEYIGSKSITIVGHSFGGRIIIKAVTRNLPFTVKRIVLIDSAGIKGKLTDAQIKRQNRFKKLKKLYSVSFMKKLFPNALEKLQNKYGSADYAAASPMMKQCLVKAVSEDLTELIPNINADTLLIWGKKDTATPYSDALSMHKMIKNSKLIGIEDAGHYPFLDAPFEFRQIIDDIF